MRIAGSFPRLPHRLIVSGETRRRLLTSLIVKRSGRFCKSTFWTAFAARFVFSVDSGDAVGAPSFCIGEFIEANEPLGGCGGVSVDMCSISKHFDAFRYPFFVSK